MDRIIERAMAKKHGNLLTEGFTTGPFDLMAMVPITGSALLRKLDIRIETANSAAGIKTIITGTRNLLACKWEVVLAAGDLKKERAEGPKPSTWYGLGQYMCVVHGLQSIRRFYHRLSLCRDMKRLRSVVNSASRLIVNEDSRKFVA